MILSCERSIRTFYGCETELRGFEEDLLKRWEDGVDMILFAMVQDILADTVGNDSGYFGPCGSYNKG